MHTKNQISLIRKTLHGIMLLGILTSTFSAGRLGSVHAQDIQTETPTPGPTETGASLPTTTQTEPPPFTPTIAPTEEILSTLNLSAAGTGSLYRARVTLKYPQDLARLKGWGVKVLEKSGGFAVVQVNPEQLSKLARLGFEPTQIDSVDYMLTVQSLTTGEILSQSDVTSSPTEMMALASVDTDSDGLTDTEESYWCTNPQDNNSDSPQAPSPTNPSDGDEVNAILNGIIAYGPPFALWPQFTPHNPNGNCPDGDFDGAPDYAEEFMIGTSNLRESSDKDKFDDGQELFGVTFCPASSGPCGYGILPRAEDAAFVTANLPAWVEVPGNSPFVAAFPEPKVEVVPSSLNLTQVTVITNTNGTTVGTEKTYGTSSTKGTSTSLANTVNWNNWTSVTNYNYDTLNTSVGDSFYFAQTSNTSNNRWNGVIDAQKKVTLADANLLCEGINIIHNACNILKATYNSAQARVQLVGETIKAVFFYKENPPNEDQVQSYVPSQCKPNLLPQCPAGNITMPSGQDSINLSTSPSQDNSSITGKNYGIDANSYLLVQPTYQMSFPTNYLTSSESSGREWGGAQTTTSTEYEEQTISQSSTNQYSDNWAIATAVDTSHAADLRFTYNIINNGTEYAREVTSLTFNVYIGSNPNPAYTYIAVGPTGQIAQIENLFPDESLTYTSNPISLTLDEMRAIDEGAPVRIVMEDIAFGQDQVFYQDAFNGSVLVAMEDGFDDNDETIDSYLIPVWDPSDTLQDVVKRYFPVIEDVDGDLLSISTPEFNTSPVTFNQHSLTGTSWWNIYLSDGLDYSGAFKSTLAKPNTNVLIRIVTDSDLDGYNNRNEIRIGTNPDDPASHPAPNLLAGYTKSCTGNDCTLRMTFQNLGNYDAYGVEAVLYSPDGLVNVTNNTIGGSGRVPVGQKIVVGPSDTFQYTKTDVNAVEPVIIVSYNDPQGNHRFILPSPALISDLNNDLTSLNGTMLPDPGVDISSTSASQANFVINSPHSESITNGKLFVEYIDGAGNVIHEDVYSQTFLSGPTVVSVPVDLNTYPPASTIILAFFTDSQGNIVDSSARPLASFGPDPLPEVNLTTSTWEIGTQQQSAQSIVDVPDPWSFGTVEPGTKLHANITLANTGLGDLRYSLSGWGNGVTVTGIAAGSLSPSDSRLFAVQINTAGLPNGQFTRTLTLRTNDPNNATVSINIQGTIATPAGTATAYQVSQYQPWNQFVYVPGPHNQNDVVNFTHTLADDPTRMFPLYLYNESGTTLKGVGEYGVDFSGQTAPFGVFGTGADGDLTVTTGQTIYTDNTRSATLATANSAQSNISLSSAAGFAAGQEVLIIQVQGTGAGVYEFANIASVASNTLTLTKNLTNTYTVGGSSKAQVIRVMQYHDVTVQSGGVMTAHAWNGSNGGIFVVRASNKFEVQTGGYANLDGIGYQGAPTNNNGYTGLQGESTAGSGAQSTSSNVNGGGGGYSSGFGNEAGGGGGGNGTAGTKGQDGQYTGGSGGGSSAIPSDLSLIVPGGGGGSGGDKADNPNPGAIGGGGGSGGGVGLIFGRQITITGTLSANGNNGQPSNPTWGDHGGGGAGAGGSIRMVGRDISFVGGTVRALGGTGGYSSSSNSGGGGGTGRIRIEYSTLTGSANPTASTLQVNFYSVTGQGAPFGVFGNGSDGDLTVTTGQTIYTDDVRSALASTASSGQSNITLSSATGFAIGKEVLIIQSQGTGAGAYEFAAITSVNGNTLTLSKSLGSTYTTGGSSKAQVIVVPQYHDVTVQSGGVLTAHAWDGSTGGIVAFRANGITSIQGIINATAIGFIGGTGVGPGGQYSYQGDGYVGSQQLSANPNGNGGGGGLQALEGGNGGGGGGNGTAGISGTTQPAHSGPGQGGLVAGSADLSTIFFGGGGGGGGRTSSNSGANGGNGGGIVLIQAKNITITGSIYSNGANGSCCAGVEGGGGEAQVDQSRLWVKPSRLEIKSQH